ncbi:MAG: hypothetical protein EXR93_02925 [Gemmatimonadetes bacterium]|nr:hypothetical protein [Gemmatimonadota bacterium]
MNIAPVLKAEAILAIQLVTRHRSPRLVLLLAAGLVLVMLSQDGGASPAGDQRSLLLVAGTLGAVAGSRLLARGGALGAPWGRPGARPHRAWSHRLAASSGW